MKHTSNTKKGPRLKIHEKQVEKQAEKCEKEKCQTDIHLHGYQWKPTNIAMETSKQSDILHSYTKWCHDAFPYCRIFGSKSQ